jgi:outer membrane protein TolC
MNSCQCIRRIRRPAFAALVSLLLCFPSSGRAEKLPEALPEAPANAALTLRACRQIALGNQPTNAATQAALKASLDRINALENLRVPTCLARDLPIRRQQAALGATIAQGAITQAEAETLHGVTCSYLGALYAAQQIKLANEPEKGILHRLKDLQVLVSDEERRRRRDVVLMEHKNLVESFLQTLEGRIQEAQQGKLRALAALREAMGVGPDVVLALPERDLPCPHVQPQLPQLLALAVARRGEMIQAATFAEVVCLEVDAQAASRRPSAKTFASGSDIHAKPVPSGDLGGVNFRPAIVGPDMPPFLHGSCEARVQQARDYYERAQALTVKTRNLIVLEVEDLYRRWVDKSEKAAHLEKAFQQARIFSESLKKAYAESQIGGYPNLDQVINSGLITTRLQLEWKEAHYQALLALAALERATAGGFAVDFDAAPACETNGKETPADENGQHD